MGSGQPSAFSIAFADTVAIGHINAGLNVYREFEALANRSRPPGEHLDFNRIIELAVPSITNLALGLELLLKVYHFQITGNYPRGHDVSVLGTSLPNEAMQDLRENYRRMFADPAVSKGVEFRFSGSVVKQVSKEWVTPDFSTYDLALKYIGPMYVRWRYIYEEFQEDTDFRICFAPLYLAAMAVHRAIRNFKGKTRVTMRDV